MKKINNIFFKSLNVGYDIFFAERKTQAFKFFLYCVFHTMILANVTQNEKLEECTACRFA